MKPSDIILILLALLGISILAIIVFIRSVSHFNSCEFCSYDKSDKCIICGSQINPQINRTTNNLYAVHVSTNLVSTPCNCGYCDPSSGIRVPEHINQIGYDLKVVVSTSFYPVVILPIEPTPSPTRK